MFSGRSPVFLIVLAEPPVESDQRLVVVLRQAVQEPLVLLQVKITVESRAVEIYARIEAPGRLRFRHGLLQHSRKPVRISELPVGLGTIWVHRQRLTQKRHGSL